MNTRMVVVLSFLVLGGVLFGLIAVSGPLWGRGGGAPPASPGERPEVVKRTVQAVPTRSGQTVTVARPLIPRRDAAKDPLGELEERGRELVDGLRDDLTAYVVDAGLGEAGQATVDALLVEVRGEVRSAVRSVSITELSEQEGLARILAAGRAATASAWSKLDGAAHDGAWRAHLGDPPTP